MKCWTTPTSNALRQWWRRLHRTTPCFERDFETTQLRWKLPRKRLLVADDEARVGFSLELAGGASASLRRASKIIDELSTDGLSDDVGATVDSAREQLARARSDLSRFAAGLGPVELDHGGLEAAIGRARSVRTNPGRLGRRRRAGVASS